MAARKEKRKIKEEIIMKERTAVPPKGLGEGGRAATVKGKARW